MLRIITPSICEVKQRHIKPYTYIIRLDVDTNAAKKKIESVISSVAEAFNRFKDNNSSLERTKYLANSFNSIFEYPKIKTKMMFEARKLQKLKPFSE